jgi:hypothetical protein
MIKTNNPIIQVLMNRDGLSFDDASEQFQNALDEFNAGVYGTDIDECLAQEFGLEPDYIFDFLENV